MSIAVDGRPIHVAGTQRRRLLALLASRAGRMTPVAMIVDALWGEDPPKSAAKTVQTHVMRLRRAFANWPADPVETVPGGYRLVIPIDDVDAGRFEALVAAGRRLLAEHQHGPAAERLGEALSLWRGPAYAEFIGVEFARVAAVHLEELRLATIEDLAECQLATGDAPIATAALERLAGEAPGRERAWGLLMRALNAAGRRHDALDAFQRARHVLAEQFGLDPGPELRALEARIVADDPTLHQIAGQTRLAAALRSSAPLVGREAERVALAAHWRLAADGRGQVCVLRGRIDSGRTRLAADLASLALDSGAGIDYVRAADGLHDALFIASDGSDGVVLDALSARCRTHPTLLVVDDAEWAAPVTMSALSTVAGAIDDLALMIVIVVDPFAGGAAVSAIDHLHAATIDVGPLGDDDVAAIVMADGVDGGGVAAVVAAANGLPGLARREAAAWAERTAGERLRAAAATSVGAIADAERAQAGVLDEVLELVHARNRRHGLVSASWIGRQPYRALATYDAQDGELFVGRERLVAELVARVLDRRFAVVVGRSGSGKSSLVRAGLVPLARSGRLPGERPWRVHVVVPGGDPVGTLDALDALEASGPQLLVVDQFEEVFAEPAPVVDAFAARLVDLAADPAIDVHVVIVVRVDHYGALADVAGLSSMLDRSQVFVGEPSADEFRRIVEEPARRTGIDVEPALVDLVVADVGEFDAALPLVSATLAELWERRDSGGLTAARYRAIGGLATSVERLGEHCVQQLDADVEPLRRLLLRFADVSDDGVWTARRLEMRDIPDDETAAVGTLVGGRLAVRGESTVEIVHEVVFRAWPRAAAWLDADRARKAVEHDVRAAAKAWEASARSDDSVLRGARLERAMEWLTEADDPPSPLVNDLLDASQAIRDADRRAAAARLARTRRLLAAIAVLLALALSAGAVALVQRSRAETARRRVAAQRDAERVSRLVAESQRLLDGHVDLALLLAVEARRHQDSPDTRGALLTALTADTSAELPTHVGLARTSTIHQTPSAFLGYLSTDGPLPTTDPEIVLADRSVDLSDDGAIAAVSGARAGGGSTVTVYDTATRKVLGTLQSASGYAAVSVAGDGRHAVATFADGVQIFDVGSRTTMSVAVPPLPTGNSYDWAKVVLGGTRLLVHADDGSLSMWDPSNGRRVDANLPDSPLADVLPGDTLTYGSTDPSTGEGDVAFWDLATGALRRSVPVQFPSGIPNLAEFRVQPGLGHLIASEYDGQVHVWDLTTGQQIGNPDDRPGAVARIGVDRAEPSLLITGSTSGAVSFYDLDHERSLGTVTGVHGNGVRGIAVSADGRHMITAGEDGLVALWGVNDESGMIVAPLGTNARSPRFSADGARVVVRNGDGQLEVRAAASLDSTGVPIGAADHQATDRQRAIISADGSTVVAFKDVHFFVADASSGAIRWKSPNVGAYNLWAAVSPNGTRVAAIIGDDARTLAVWDGRTGAELARTEFTAVSGGRDGNFNGEPVFTADGAAIDVPTSLGPMRIRTTDLSLVASGTSTGAEEANLVQVPGTNDVIGDDGAGRVAQWDMTTGKLVASAASPDPSSVGALALSPDGSLLAAYMQETSRIALFDVATLRPIGRPFPVGDDFFWPEFVDAGKRLAGDGIFNQAVTWDVDPDSWQTTACAAAGRNLTRAEWAEYFGTDEPYRATCPQYRPG